MELADSEKRELLDVANALADAGREVTLKYFRTDGLQADNKDAAAYDPVTRADREAELAIRAILETRRPEDGILGEEFPDKPTKSGLTWVIDPIDGTRAYISGNPSWGILIGLDDGNGPILGIVDQPYIGERFIGGFGKSEMVRGDTSQTLKTSTRTDLSDAILFTTFPEVGTDLERQAFSAVRDQVRLTRYGLDCYAYMLLAMGQIDIVIEAGLHPFDVQGPIGVIKAAGGIITNWQGEPVHMGGQVLAAGNATMHAHAMEIIRKLT